MRRYEKEFRETVTRDGFIKIVMKEHKTKKPSAYRAWYKIRKYLKAKEVQKYDRNLRIEQEKEVKLIPLNNLTEPSKLKMITINDMKSMKIKMTEDYLKKHGFIFEELNWLKHNGYI